MSNILNYDAFIMLNEGFKSKTISELINKGELNVEKNEDRALFNQISEDEILGIVDNEEEAQKLIQDTFGDMVEKRYNYKRVWFKVGPDDYDDDIEPDYDHPYEVNKTKEEFRNWILPLNSGKLLVLKIEKSELDSRLWKIRGKRRDNKYVKVSDIRKKFLQRKEFIENNKGNFEEYRKLVKYLDENGLTEEFVEKTNEILNSWSETTMDDSYFADTVFNCKGTYCDEGEEDYEIGNLKININFEAEFDGNINVWSDSGDYWHPGYTEYEIEDGSNMVINYIHFYILDKETEEELFEFDYLPGFDHKNNLYIK